MKRKRSSRKVFREQYAEISSKEHSGPHPPAGVDATGLSESLGYSEDELKKAPEAAIQMGLGCGNPTALAELREGEVVLDLGCGGGLDVFIAAQKVGPKGKVIGVDMTPEMVEKARRFATEGGYENVEFKVGQIESLPNADESVDVVISNCVINHSPDRLVVFKEAFRVLRPTGRICVSDLVVEGEPPHGDAPGLEVWAEWLKVACGRQEYLNAIEEAGFKDITIARECPFSGPGMIPALAGKVVSLQLKAYR